jgi:uncharacterized protein
MRVTGVVTLAWALIAFSCSGSLPAHAQNRVALIVGNSHYQNAPALPSTSNDATDIAQSFERLGFAATRLIDASYEDFRHAIRKFNELTPNADIAVIYFGGHGLEVNGENWLLPVDADLRTDLDVANDAIGLKVLMQSVGRASDLGMVILDASRSNVMAARVQRTGDTRGITRGLGRVDPAQNVLVAYASKEGTTTEDKGGRNSPYATALLKYLEQPGLDVNFMFRKVRDDVLAQTSNRQLPSVYGSLPHRPIYLKQRSITIVPVDDGNPAMPSDEAVWMTIKDSTDKALFLEFLDKFPSSMHAREAGTRLQTLDANIVVASRQTAAPAGGVDACDHLAASPLDHGRSQDVAGVELSKIPVIEAAHACDEAMRRAPGEARFPYQAARVALARADYATARALYEKAGMLGSPQAMYSLGLLYKEGKIGPADYTEARHWFMKAVAMNYAVAMAELADLYEKGLGGPKNAGEAFKLYRAAATAGDQVSMTKVGNFYEAGAGIRKDYVQAANWYRKAAERGDAAAMKQLGGLYESGRGVRKSAAEAKLWKAKAAKLEADAGQQ